MKMFSLKTLIDDILLIIRNNNISESEDFSRAQIAAWIMAYKALLTKKKQDKDKEDSNDDNPDDSLQQTIGPLELEDVESLDDTCLHRKRVKVPSLLGDSADNIISVCDQEGCVIQFMHEKRRHYHYHRRYTFGDMTCWFEDGYIYVEGLVDLGNLKYITVTGVFSDDDEDGKDEEDVNIPGWMIPDIKKMIMDNELKFMLNRPSDDSNNSTLASVKPHGPQDQEE